MKVVAIGRTRLLYDAISELVKNGHEISHIITTHAAPEYDVKERDFFELSKQLGCPFSDLSSSDVNLDSVLDSIKGADLGISVNWTKIITEKIVNHFKIGILNAHLGDLPQYRGNACPNWAIISGDNKVVLTIHLMEGGCLDCGRIICQEQFMLEQSTTIGNIYDWSRIVTPRLFFEAITFLESDPEFFLKYAKCEDSEGFRCYPRTPDDSFINWNMNAVDIDRLVRASSHPFRGAYTYFVEDGLLKKLYIHKSSVYVPETSDLGSPGRILLNDKVSGCTRVMCGRGVLELLQCQIEDGELFAPGEHFRSIRIKLGVRLEDFMWEKMREGKMMTW